MSVLPASLVRAPPRRRSKATGRNQVGSLGPIGDHAGNTTVGTSSPAVNIDKTAPTVTASTAATAIVVAGTDWYKDSVTFQWSASDPLLADGSAGSGAGAPAPSSRTFDTTGAHGGRPPRPLTPPATAGLDS